MEFPERPLLILHISLLFSIKYCGSSQLEHIPNPIYLCEQVFKLLKPGGVLCIESPNDFNPIQKIANSAINKKQWWISIPHHLNYFSFDSLKNLVTRSGFSVISTFSTFPMEFFLLLGDNYIDEPNLGLRCHQKRMDFEQKLLEFKPEFLDDLYRVLAKHGCGRSVVIFAIKP